MGTLISVLVPVFNPGEYLSATVQSVLAQTYPNFEVLLIDDASTEAWSCPEDERIQVLRQAHAGAPAALNRGLEVARGELIAFLDHDDLWRPGKLARHAAWFRDHSDCDLAFDWSRRIDSEGQDLGLPCREWHGPIQFRELLQDFVAGNTSAIVARRSAIHQVDGFNAAFPRVYDVDLCLRIAALRESNCQSVPEQLTFYRRHQAQMSRDWRSLEREWARFLECVSEYAPHPIDSILPLADSNMRRYFSYLAFESRDYRTAFRSAVSATGRAGRASLLESRNWKMLAAASAGCLLPEWAMDRLRRAVS